MGTLSVTRKTSNTVITAAGFNTNFDEIEAVINGAIEAANIADDAVTAAKIHSGVVRADYGLVQHTDGSLYVDVSDTNPGLELTDGGLRVKSYGMAQRTANGLEIGRTSDLMQSAAASVPDGWTDVTATYANRYVRIGSTGLSTGGASTHAHGAVTGSHVLTSSEIPDHTHNLGAGTSIASGGNYNTHTGTMENVVNGSGHTHTIASADNNPLYVDMKLFSKN